MADSMSLTIRADRLQGSEKSLPLRKRALPASDAMYLDQAQLWSRDLTRMRSRGPGDTENAMRAVAREYGIDYGFLWSLRYRRAHLKVISHAVYECLREAYLAECARQMRKLENEIAATDPDHVGQARALVSQTKGSAKC